MTPQEMLEQMIDKAWETYNEVLAQEIEDDYSDAMVSMERTEAEGFALGLQTGYFVAYDKHYESEVAPMNADEYERLMGDN